MVDSSKSALELLETLRSERAELDSLIQGLEKRLGVVPPAMESSPATANAPRVTVSLDSIPVGFFHNLSQVSATEKLLRMNPGHPLSTTEILDAFRKSGVELTSRNAATILYTSLKRNPKFERVAGSAWGLAEWYPQKRKSKEETVIVFEEGGKDDRKVK
jgi:hypothetical protein